MRKKLIERLQPKCPECIESIVVCDEREGRHVCTNCGLVVGDRIISDESEWRTFAESSTGVDMNRVGGPSHPLLEDENVSSTQIGPSANNSMLTRGQIRVTSDKTQRLRTYYKQIQEIIKKLHLSASVKLITETIFKQIFDQNTVKGRSSEVVIVACVYVACKLECVPRTLRELANVCGVKRRDVGRKYIAIQKLQQDGKLVLKKSVRKNKGVENNNPFVTRFGSILNLPPHITKEAIKVCKKAGQESIGIGKPPALVAATSILLVAHYSPPEENQKSEDFVRILRESEGISKISAIGHLSKPSLRNLFALFDSKATVLLSLKFQKKNESLQNE